MQLTSDPKSRTLEAAKDLIVTISTGHDPAYMNDAPRVELTVKATPLVGVDRDFVAGWVIGPVTPYYTKLANRLKAAIEADMVFLSGVVTPDVADRTYLSTTRPNLGRYLNADLKRMGF